jgi:hypothetical protein
MACNARDISILEELQQVSQLAGQRDAIGCIDIHWLNNVIVRDSERCPVQFGVTAVVMV